ncbi:HNH endonuclease domain-containing protein [Actinocorallia sp. A-T 12471]|uniref:HNH endonuclease domain-containing protein n=1 Tax=Actinocorallia sp. A-T 12471 TaxID=3089813 RepID=UPI0029CAD794|nr:HNH endonuclease domain-containing protein [Actinocorallia sp. A-T 12471]MDX6742464.1 HNH endonuclease domain-containing protein [Actinocorallia sp. A-T 12471]
MTADFFRHEPTARSSWRLAVLMGANARTYKFALGSALLGFAAEGRDDVPLDVLASAYAMGIVDHLDAAPQAPRGSVGAPTDFLNVATREAAASKAAGSPTEELLRATVATIPGMVMRKFHNLRGENGVPHRFYELDRGSRMVRLLPALREIASGEELPGLRRELDARWNIVEFSFSAEIGRSLTHEGFALDSQAMLLTDRRRRRAVTGVVPAVTGFQYGRCLICWQPLDDGTPVAVDHVLPFSLMSRFSPWPGPDLDAVWNLAPTHAPCNSGKSDRMPTAEELGRLTARNTAIMDSPHPLSRTLDGVLKNHKVRTWYEFLREVTEIVR